MKPSNREVTTRLVWGPCSPEVMMCNVTKASVRLGECSVIRGGRWLQEVEVGVKGTCYFFSVWAGWECVPSIPGRRREELAPLPWRLEFDTRWLFFPQLKTGSLLSQPKAVLQKLAALSDLNPSAPRNSRNFIFHTLSPVKAEATKESSKPRVGNLRTDLVTLQSRVNEWVNWIELNWIENIYVFLASLQHKDLCCSVNLAYPIRYKGIATPQ